MSWKELFKKLKATYKKQHRRFLWWWLERLPPSRFVIDERNVQKVEITKSLKKGEHIFKLAYYNHEESFYGKTIRVGEIVLRFKTGTEITRRIAPIIFEEGDSFDLSWNWEIPGLYQTKNKNKLATRKINA